MGLFDSIFGSGQQEPTPTNRKYSGGLFGGLDPTTVGLLSASASLLESGGPSRVPISTGQALGRALNSGLLGYTGAVDRQSEIEERDERKKYRQSQMEQYDLKNAALKTQQTAIANLKAKMAQDPTYKATPAELMEIDTDAAFKHLNGGGAVDFGLEPKIGVNKATGKHEFFIQDKRGGTKWLDVEVPNNFKIIPGNEYQAPTAVNPRDGTVRSLTPSGQQAPGGVSGATPPGIVPMPPLAGGAAPAPGGYPIDPSQQGDPFAPWNNITSPKEIDQFKARQFEQDNKRLDEIRKQVTQGRAVMTDLNRFGELNRQTETGSWIDQAEKLPTFDPHKKEMQAITARVAPNQRVEGSGGTSDRDMGLYLQGLPGIDKTGDVNANIRKQYGKQLQDAENRFRFQENYLANRGHLNGVDEAYERHQYKQSGKPDGLDISKLTPEQQAYLRQQNPEAFETGAKNFARTTAAANKPKSKAIKLEGGGSAFASLGPDGNYYVERGGKRYRVEE